MAFLDIVLGGVVLGGMYALIAMGLNLQYGVARIMNLAYGEFLMIGAFATYWLFTSYGIDPMLGLLLGVPAAFAANWLVYVVLMRPLVARAKGREQLEADSILATFGLLFFLKGSALAAWSGDERAYSYLQEPVHLLGATFAANRLLAFAAACLLGGGAWLLLTRTRVGTAVRAVAVDPGAAQLVAVDVKRYSALAFAAGGAMAAAAGALVSMFLTFSPAVGVEYTLKALIVVIMGGVGHMMGSLVAGIILGLAEAIGAWLVDPGLTLAINFSMFLAILLWRPKGLFGGR